MVFLEEDKDLPDPDFFWTYNDISIYIYCAKKKFSKQWTNPILRHIVMDARQSFKRYGPVPLVDVYDDKSSVYLARAVYPSVLIDKYSNSVLVEEWLSLRFISAAGNPEFTEDLKDCIYDGNPVYNLVRDELFKNSIDFNEKIISISRLCSIPSRFFNRQQKNFTNKLLMMPVLFLLSVETFLQESISRSENIEYFTALLRPEVLEKSLGTMLGKNFHFYLTSLADILKLDSHITINDVLCYQYPGYFLKMSKLIQLLKYLMDRGILTKQTIAYYLGDKNIIEKMYLTNKYESNMLVATKNLGDLLSTKDIIYGSLITGEELRMLIKNDIEYGAILTMTKTKLLLKQINDVKKNINLALV